MTFQRAAIKAILQPLITAAYTAQNGRDNLRRNTIDVFSATIESVVKGISFEEWLVQEEQRQIQKTLQNQIGEFHQKVLGTLNNVTNLGVGQIIDVESDALGLIAEIKNKHNTTKGNHKKAIYDDLHTCLANKPVNTTGYYVEILPKNGKSYNEIFTPSDNENGTNRPANGRIRRVDGQTFYQEITRNPNALRELYMLTAELSIEIMREQYGINLDIADHIAVAEFNIIYGPNR